MIVNTQHCCRNSMVFSCTHTPHDFPLIARTNICTLRQTHSVHGHLVTDHAVTELICVAGHSLWSLYHSLYRDSSTAFSKPVYCFCSNLCLILSAVCMWVWVYPHRFDEVCLCRVQMCVRVCFLTSACALPTILCVYFPGVDVFQPRADRWWLHRSAASVQSQEPAGQN